MTKNDLIKIGVCIDNEFLDKYVELVNHNKDVTKQSFITQDHHIIPKYYFKYTNQKIDNSDSNIVTLRYADHLLAHYYLMKCSSIELYEYYNSSAMFYLKDFPKSIDLENWIQSHQELLDEACERHRKYISEHHADVSGELNPRATYVFQYDNNAEIVGMFKTIKECAEFYEMNADGFRASLSNQRVCLRKDSFFSKYSDITISDISSLKQHKENVSKHCRYPRECICELCGKSYTLLLSNSAYQHRIDTKVRSVCATCNSIGNLSKGTKHSDTHKQKISETAKGRKWINNGVEQKQVHPEIIQNYLDSGWVLGQIRGRKEK